MRSCRSPSCAAAGYDGPIIVVSGAVTQARRSRLIAGGASDVIHKDDVDSVRLAEAVDRSRASIRRLADCAKHRLLTAVTCRRRRGCQHSAASLCLMVGLVTHVRGSYAENTRPRRMRSSIGKLDGVRWRSQIAAGSYAGSARRLRERRAPHRVRRCHADLFRGEELRHRQVRVSSGKRCKVELASAGYSGPSNVPKSGIKADSIKAASAKPVSIKTLFNW